MSKITKSEKEVKRYSSPAEIEKEIKERYAGPKNKKTWKIIVSQNKWLNDLKKLNPVQKCIYLDLMFFDRNKGDCYPSEKTIAKNLNINRKTVYRNLEILAKKKIVKITKSFGKVNHYEINN